MFLQFIRENSIFISKFLDLLKFHIQGSLLWVKSFLPLTSYSVNNLWVILLVVCVKTFPEGTEHTHILTPDRILMTDQSTNTTEVQLCESYILLGLLTGEWRNKWLKHSWLTKAHLGMGDNSQNQKPGTHCRACRQLSMYFLGATIGLNLIWVVQLFSTSSRQLVWSQSRPCSSACLSLRGPSPSFL